jgi:hypothetical protein
MKLAAVSTAIVFALQAYPPPFPRDGVTKVLENERVVAWQVQWSKGRPTAMHEHVLDLVGVVLEPGQVKVTFPDGSVNQGTLSQPAAASFMPRGMIHQEESVVDGGRTIAIELKAFSPPAPARNTTAAEAFPRDGARQLIDNNRVVVWDYQWVPGRPVSLHVHNRDTLLVPVENGEVTVRFRNGETRISRLVRGEVLFFSGADAHSEEATAGSPRAIVVELK